MYNMTIRPTVYWRRCNVKMENALKISAKGGYRNAWKHLKNDKGKIGLQ